MEHKVEKPDPKSRLLAAAYELFGDRDPSDVSVREIANKAGVNIASINYHFRSKEGLYLAIGEMLLDIINTNLSPLKSSFEEDKKRFFSTKEQSPTEIADFYLLWYKKLIEAVARIIYSRYLIDNKMHKLLIREQMNPSAAFHNLYERGISIFLDLMDEFMENITGVKKCKENILRVHAIFGQIIVFIASSATIEKRIEHSKMDKNDIEDIIKIITEHTDVILTHLKTKACK